MRNSVQTSLPAWACVLLLAGCSDSGTTEGTPSGQDAGADTNTAGDSGSTKISLNEGYQKATWGSGVTVTYGDCTLRYKSNGLPNHDRDSEYALPNSGVRVPSASSAHAGADPTAAQNYDVTLNTCPTLQSGSTSSALGNIGYMISGASLFNPYEGDGSTIALASNFSVKDSSGNDVFFVDSCNGHPTPMGQYHYHGLPACVTAQVDAANGPSHIIGIALDGFPVYGNRDASGNEVTESQLDECNGITSATPEFPNGVYHYVLLNAKDGASSLRCYKGTPAKTASIAPAACSPGVALAQRDVSPWGRILNGVIQSIRNPVVMY